MVVLKIQAADDSLGLGEEKGLGCLCIYCVGAVVRSDHGRGHDQA